jgi:hypothetical protein
MNTTSATTQIWKNNNNNNNKITGSNFKNKKNYPQKKKNK